MTARHAVYFAPALDSPWWRFGAQWLGRDEQRGTPLLQPAVPGFTREEFQALTAEPRRYGFHATLKAPFRLREPLQPQQLHERLQALAAQLHRLALGSLLPCRLQDFVALVPQPPQPAVAALAMRCVTDLDDLRAPPSAEELARREAIGLDERQRELLWRYGYPQVMERYRFHLTLSGKVDAATADRLVAQVREGVATLNAQHPPVLDRLCLFREDAPGAPFLRVAEWELAP